jgi:hypothetical protein
MAYNEYLINRVAFGTFSFPANAAAISETVLSAPVLGVYIPTGAIITAIKYVPIGALTAMASGSNLTINPYIGTQPLGTANAVASAALLAGSIYNQTVVSAGIGSAPIVQTGGPLSICFGTTGANRSDMSANVGVYIGYLASV